MMRAVPMAAVCAALAAMGGRVFADDFAVAQIPTLYVVSVTAGGTVPEKGGVDAVAEGTASRAGSGDRLLRSLNIVSPPADFSPEVQRERYESGENAFFAGKLEAAALHFGNIAAAFEANPESAAFYPALRSLLFRSLLHLAVVAHGRGDRLLAEKYTERAVRMGEPVPSASEFPPWLGRLYEEIRARLSESASGRLSLYAESGCTLIWNGRSLGAGPVYPRLPEGDAFVRVRCGEKVSPVQRVTVPSGGNVSFRPAILSVSEIRAERSGARLDAPAKASDADLIRDLVAVGRAAGVERLLGVISRKSAASLVLVDVRTGRRVRAVPVSTPLSATTISEASGNLAAEANLVRRSSSVTTAYDGALRPWYKDGAAWSATLCGAAALGAGVALAATRGTASRTAPWAAGLMAAGGAAVIAGTVLFFIQPTVSRAEEQPSAAVGVTVRGFF